MLYAVACLMRMCYCLLRCHARCMCSTATCKLRLLEGKRAQSKVSHIASKFCHSEALRTASSDCRQTYVASQGRSHFLLARGRHFLVPPPSAPLAAASAFLASLAASAAASLPHSACHAFSKAKKGRITVDLADKHASREIDSSREAVACVAL